MSKSRKFFTWFLVLLGAVLVIIFIAASVYINRFKPHLESLLTRNIGMQTIIDGRISLKMMPGLSFAARKVKVINNETYVLRLEKIEIYIDYSKLFDETIHVKELHFKEPQLFVVRYLDGSYNYQTAMASAVPQEMQEMANHFIDLSALSVVNGTVLYIDQTYKDTLKIDGINLESEDIGLQGTVDDIDENKFRFRGPLGIDRLKLNNLVIDSMRFEVIGNKGFVTIDEKSRPFLGGEVAGQIMLDFNQEPYFIRNQHSVSGLDMDAFFESIGSESFLSGYIDYALDINFRSYQWTTALETMNGTFDMNGKDLVIHGLNLHGMLDRLTTDEYLNSIDLVAVFLAGPYGAVFSRGMDLQELYTGDPADQTPVKEMISNWELKNGIAYTKDAAINTGKYRLAMNGGLDFTNDTFRNMEIAILNREGCAAFSQTLQGPFMNPKTQGMLNLGLFSGNIDELPKMLNRPAPRGCKPFYSGAVKHP